MERFEEINELSAAVARTSARIKEHLKCILDELASVDAAAAACTTAFATTKVAFDKAYEEAVVQQAAHKNLLDDNQRLSADLQTLERAYATIIAKESETQQAVTSFESAQAELRNLLTERWRVLKEAADKVSGKSSGLLKARVKRDTKLADYIQSLSAFFEGSGVQDVAAKCEELASAAVRESGTSSWATICNELIQAYEAKIRAGSPSEPDKPSIEALERLFKRKFTFRQASRIYQNINDTNVGAILSSIPKDFIVLTYVDEGRDLDFKKSSPGQQASALLELLLNQSAATLIIDQPEDDLDNRVIMKIVDLIRTSKNRRQLIFTTHNSNVVVNGDADKIVALVSAAPAANPRAEGPRIRIATDGAIETPEVRAAITQIMEGGEEAFDLRRRKYRFSASP